MAINFPASPSEGDLYSYNGTNYTFDGVKWVSGGATVFLQKAGDDMSGDLTLGVNQVVLGTNGTGYFSSNLGVGTSAPVTQLDVEGATNTGGSIYVTGEANINEGLLGQFGFYNKASQAASDPLRAYVTSTRENGSWGADLQFFTSTGTGAATSKLTINEAGNVGIGASAPSANLHVLSSGATEIRSESTGDNALISVNNSSSVPWILTQRSDTSNGLSIRYAGNNYVNVDTSGNVGIGTSPSHKLHVNGVSRFDNHIEFGGSISTPSTAAAIYRPADNQLAFSTANTEAMRLDADGRLLVGTSSANDSNGSSNLIVEANGLSDTSYGGLTLRRGTTFIENETSLGRIFFADRDGNLGARISGLSDSTWSTGDYPGVITFDTTSDGTASPTERMRLDADGRLLVGTTSDVSGGTTSTGIQIATTGGGYLGLAKDDASVVDGNGLGGLRIYANDPSGYNDVAILQCVADGTHNSNDYPTRWEFHTTADGASSPTERMRISSSGAFTSYTNGSFHGFKTNATSAASEFLRFQNNASNLSTGTTIARIRADGDFENANNSYTGLSDAKLKENIVDASSQWEDIKALRVRNYNFKQDTGFGTHTQLGVIAQEAETVSPGLIKEAPDLDNEGNDLGTTTKTVNYSVLYMKSVKALQEAMARIESLETRISQLEG